MIKNVYTGGWKTGHVQGIAIDTKREYMYFSFTTVLVKTDLSGNVIGFVGGLRGHLGCIAFNDDDGCVYGSLEYKNDAIGRGIDKSGEITDAFYIAVFDVDKITHSDMDAEKDGIMTTVYLKEVLADYAGIGDNGKLHRFGCSGIDGTTIAPDFGADSDSKKYLFVAYGVYGDKERTDNDYQVILKYDINEFGKYKKPLEQKNMHKCGPDKPLGKYFFYTGNTVYGIQNLEYDAYTARMYAAVYSGQKTDFPNYSLFAIDMKKAPKRELLKGFENEVYGDVIESAESENIAEYNGKRVGGWRFPHGSTGLIALGDGYYYISHDGHDENGHSSDVRLYKYDEKSPFSEAE